MEDQIYKKYELLRSLNVSRETCVDFERLIVMIQDKNKEMNLISKKTSSKQSIRTRHIIDSAQIIDIVDLNINTTSDLGSGSGMPGLVTAIMIKNLKKKTKVLLYEKSYHKSKFLREVSTKLNLHTEVIQKDIFKLDKISTGTIMARAFKPLPEILELVQKKFNSFENLIIFMGKNGKQILNETLKSWEISFSEKKSITNQESFLLNIKKIKKIR
jgi:16S rRNA (guanine527-N7)-methyltransferase